MKTISDLLRAATAELNASSPTPRLDAELLLGHVLAWSRARLLAERDQRLSAEQQVAFATLVARRVALEPVAYLVGHKEFYGLELEVTPATLVPRPETELLVELALVHAARRTPHAARLSIADIGTGSGAIALALAVHLPEATIYASDLSSEALAVAARNLARHGLSERVALLQGDLLAPLPAAVDLIVSNPPYTILAEVEANVRAHEPHLALDGGHDGAAIYRRLIPALGPYLRPGGAALLEIGAWQGELVVELAQAHYPQSSVSLHHDLAGRPRVVTVTGL
jgi:release factor glutamine methyltransferase